MNMPACGRAAELVDKRQKLAGGLLTRRRRSGLSAWVLCAGIALLLHSPVFAKSAAAPAPRAAPQADSAAPADNSPVAPQGDAGGSGDDLDSSDGAALDGDTLPDPTNPDGTSPDAAPIDLNPAAAPPDPSGAPVEQASPSDGPLDLRPNDGQPALLNSSKAGITDLGIFMLDARLTEAGPPIDTGMTWRVFGGNPAANGKLTLVGEAHGGSLTLKLRPATYYIHASYGHAGAVKKVVVGDVEAKDTVVLNAGAIRLTAFVGKDRPLPAEDVAFDVYAPDEGGSDERALVLTASGTGKAIGLNAGVYQVVCRYGDANAIVRADIKVEPGKLTEAAIYQKAARLTLKLVSEHGGEAMANTAWSVVTPSGDGVADFVGAFPSVVLAVGDYTAIAKHDGKIFERTFTVEAGVNRDIEVMAANE